MKILGAILGSILACAVPAPAQDFSEKIQAALEDMLARKERRVNALIELDEDRIFLVYKEIRLIFYLELKMYSHSY